MQPRLKAAALSEGGNRHNSCLPEFCFYCLNIGDGGSNRKEKKKKKKKDRSLSANSNSPRLFPNTHLIYICKFSQILYQQDFLLDQIGFKNKA